MVLYIPARSKEDTRGAPGDQWHYISLALIEEIRGGVPMVQGRGSVSGFDCLHLQRKESNMTMAMAMAMVMVMVMVMARY